MSAAACCVAALVCGSGAIALGTLGSFLGVDGSDGTWMLWIAASLLCVAMTAFLYAADRRSR